MTVRTDSDSVKAVLLRDYDTRNSPSLDPFIRAASLIVDRVAACASLKGIMLSTDEKLDIETWLAAHAYQASDPGYKSKSTSSASGSFTGEFDKGFESTRYGAMALSLDNSGCLAAIGKRQAASMYWLGKVPSEQTDYQYRR